MWDVFRVGTFLERDILVHQTFRTFQIGLFTGCRKKIDQEEKVTTKIECCGAKFYHGKDFGALDPA